MTTHALMEYLQQFSPESLPSIAVIDHKRRLEYPVRDVIGITGGEDNPAIILDVGEAESLDKEDEDG